jgi:hypothetical protein
MMINIRLVLTNLIEDKFARVHLKQNDKIQNFQLGEVYKISSYMSRIIIIYVEN